MTRTMRPARPHPIDEEAPIGNRTFIYALLGIVLIAFAGFVWNLYGGREPERITPPSSAYKVEPSSDSMTTQIPDESPGQNVSSDSGANAPVQAAEANERAAANDAADTSDDGVEATAVDEPPPPAQSGAPRLSAAPSFSGNGAYVAQLAALRSEDAVAPAWARLSSRAPDLFGRAHLDVERADLGQRGVYFRVRAGYFADRTQAGLFCDRIRNMGQDCIVVAR